MFEKWNCLTTAFFLGKRLVDYGESPDKIDAKCIPLSETHHSGSLVF
jgi:hypothetical protein